MENQAGKDLVLSFVAIVQKYYRMILCGALGVALIATYFSVLLYKNLRTDMEELLPDSAQSVKDLKEVTGRISGFNHLSIVLETDDPQSGRRLQADVAKLLQEKLPPEMYTRIQYHARDEIEFFKKHRFLYFDYSDLKELQNYVRERLRKAGAVRRARAKAVGGVFSLGLDDEKDDAANTGAENASNTPDLDGGGIIQRFTDKYSSRANEYVRFPDGLFESADGRTHAILIFLAGKVTDIDRNKELSRLTMELVSSLRTDSGAYGTNIRIGYSGDVQNVVEEHEGVVEDLLISSIIVLILVFLILFFYFRSLLFLWALGASLFVGTVLTFAISYFVVGYLNANTAFLGSIVLGNGINFGIILMAIYSQNIRAEGRIDSSNLALVQSVRSALRGTMTASIAAGVSYLSLILTNFRGFNQFGVIGAIGMVCCWASAFIMIPAFLEWFAVRGWSSRYLIVDKSQSIDSSMPKGPTSYSNSKAQTKYRFVAHLVVFFFATMSIVSIWVLSQNLRWDKVIETDFSNLRNERALKVGSGFWGAKVDQLFGKYLTPTVVLTDSVDDARLVAEQLRLEQQRLRANPMLDRDLIADIATIDKFVPSDQHKKIELYKWFSKTLSSKVFSALPEKERSLAEFVFGEEFVRSRVVGNDKISQPLELTGVTSSDIPLSVRSGFTDSSGCIGCSVHVYPALSTTEKTGFWDGKAVVAFAEAIRRSIGQASVRAFVAGQAPLSADMIKSIMVEGPTATKMALLGVSVIIFLVFGFTRTAFLILTSLYIGVLLLAGISILVPIKINFLNFIALPITFGIGVDYAVNYISIYRQLAHSRAQSKHKYFAWLALKNIGSAVVACSLTTIVGYGALLLAGSKAFQSFGALAVIGEITCLLSGLLFLPALLTLKDLAVKD